MYTFTEAVKICLFEKYLTFQGRAARSEYWYFMLFSWLTGLICSVFEIIPLLGQILHSLISLALFFPCLSVTVRRLHDLDKSGWWLLAPFVSSAAALIMTTTGIFSQNPIITVLGMALLLVAAISFILLLVFSILRGTSGPNRFGGDPLVQMSFAKVKLKDALSSDQTNKLS